jgi:hypothetical protein
MGKKQAALQVLLCTTVLLLGGSLLGTSIISSADTVAIIHPDPIDAAVAPGDSAAVSVWIEDVSDLYGAQIHLRFDPAVIQIQDADPDEDGLQVRHGSLLDPAQGFVAANRADNETGELAYALTLLSPASPANGSGALIWIDFVALAVGRSEWAFQEVILATRNGASIPVDVETGWVTVGEAPSTPPTPTNTPVPTDTPPAGAPSPSAVAPGASPTPTVVAGRTLLPTPTAAPSLAVPVPTDGSPEVPTSEPGQTPPTAEAPGTQLATLPPSSEGAMPTASPTRWPTLAVPTRASSARTTPEAGSNGVQAALPSLLMFAGAVVVFVAGLGLYRWRKRQHQR